jgi:hypothetical protein
VLLVDSGTLPFTHVERFDATSVLNLTALDVSIVKRIVVPQLRSTIGLLRHKRVETSCVNAQVVPAVGSGRALTENCHGQGAILGMTPESANSTIDRLEDQIRWYDRKSAYSQVWFKWLKGLTLISGVLVPVFSSVTWGRFYAGALGIVIVIAEGLQQLNQYHANWIAYRSTCESLKHEKYLYFAQAGPYAASAKPLSLLAERVEGLVSQEHAKWVSSQEQMDKTANAERESKPPA